MTLTIIIFFIAITLAFGMLMFRAWEIRTNRISSEKEKYTPELSFRRFEKIFLYLAKHTIQWIVLSCVKIWYLVIAKTKVWFQNKLPKVNKLFEKKVTTTDSRKISFVERAIMESKIKIKKVKEKIKKDHEEEIKNFEEEIKEQTEKVDKIV